MYKRPCISTNPQNTDGDAAFNEKELEFDEKKPEFEVNVSPSSSAQSKKHDDKTKREAKGKSPVESLIGYRNLSAEFEDFFDNSINEVNATELEDITYSDDEDDVGVEADFNNLETSIIVSHIPTTRVHKDHPADFNNLETSIIVSPIPTTRVHKDHPVTQIIGDLSSATQTRSMKRVAKDQGGLSQIFNDDFHTVNTPRSDEDRLELIELTIFLLPSDETVRVEVNDVTRLQALMDKKKVVVTEATIRNALCLDDAEGVECKGFFGVETPLFEGMLVAQEVGEGVSDEVHDEGVPAAGVATEGVVSAADDVILTADEEPSIPSPTLPTPPTQPSHDIPSTSQIAQALEITKLKRRVKKLKKRKKVKVLKLRRLKRIVSSQRINTSDDTVMDNVSNHGRMITGMDANADVVLEEAKDVAEDAKDGQDVDVQVNADIQGRTAEFQAEIYKINLDHANKVLSMQEEESKPAELQEVVDIVTTAKIITEVVIAASTTIIAADVPIPTATTAVALTLTAAPSRRTKGLDTIRQALRLDDADGIDCLSNEEIFAELSRMGYEKPPPKLTFYKRVRGRVEQNHRLGEVIDHVNKKSKEDPAVKMYQALKRKPHTEVQARKNMIIYSKNVVGFYMDYFKRMSYDDIRPIFEAKFDSNVAFLQKIKEQIDEDESRALEMINETPAEK
nr:hypothetical protein [Tanacetum cinerariifolium]